MSFWPGLIPSVSNLASSFSVPPLTPMIFWRSIGTDVSAKSCALKVSTDSLVSSSTS